jgi:transcriptional regulator with XRE-family HTH domain
METLGEYLDRMMRQKNLTPKELAKRCKVTDSYIGRIRKGESDNLTVQTMVMLANGLGVNPHDIFTAASGTPVDRASHMDPLLLLHQLQELIHEPTGLEVLRQWLQLPSGKQERLLGFIAFLNQPRPEPKNEAREK